MVAARFPSLLCAAFAVIILGPARPGYAELDYHLAAAESTGVTDRAEDQSAGASKGTDGFETLEGRLQLGHTSRLTTDQLGYAIMATTWFQSAPRVYLTHTLNLSSDIQPGPDTRLMLAGSAILTQPSMLDSAGASDPQAAGPRPVGNREFLTLYAHQALSWQLGAAWSVGQSLDGRIYRPISDDSGSLTNKSLSFAAQVNHQWQRDSAGLQTSLGVIESTGTGTTDPQTGLLVTPSQQSEFGDAMLSWKHEWTPELNHQASAGVFVLRTDRTRVLPAGSATVLWRHLEHSAQLSAGRSADSNIYVGAAYERTYAMLRVDLGLDRVDTLRLLAEANLEHDTTTAGATGTEGSANVFFGRLALRWRPGDTFRFALEYLIRDQHATSGQAGNTSPFASLNRQTVMLTVEVSYPQER